MAPFLIRSRIFAVVSPAERVQFILGDNVDVNSHLPHSLFSEMQELVKIGNEAAEWQETARWVKFEENVEEGGDRWSKPHVATLSLHALFELRSLLTNGSVILDMETCNFEEVINQVCDTMVNTASLPLAIREKAHRALLLRHRHQNERRKKNFKKVFGMLNIKYYSLTIHYKRKNSN